MGRVNVGGIMPAGTAIGTDVLPGKTFMNSSGILLPGQMTTKAAATYTPGTTDQIISAAQYLSGDQTIKGDANLIAANIKSGVSIFGKVGTLASGKMFYTGNFTVYGTFNGSTNGTLNTVTVNGVGFVPSVIVLSTITTPINYPGAMLIGDFYVSGNGIRSSVSVPGCTSADMAINCVSGYTLISRFNSGFYFNPSGNVNVTLTTTPWTYPTGTWSFPVYYIAIQ